jgi:hypothetical protein
VAELYAPDGVLLATASPKLRVGREDIENYFMYFLSLKPEGTIIEGHVQLLCDTLVGLSNMPLQFNYDERVCSLGSLLLLPNHTWLFYESLKHSLIIKLSTPQASYSGVYSFKTAETVSLH